LKLKLIRQHLDDKYREKYMYKGNTDKRDSLDQYLVNYLRENQFYLYGGDTIQV